MPMASPSRSKSTRSSVGAHYLEVAISDRLASLVLQEHVSPGLSHNYVEHSESPRCHPDTRIAVQEELLSWIANGHQDEAQIQILWITWPPGTGKTVIAGSVADTCEREGLLAASIFFSSYSGSADRCSKLGLITSIAYQLAEHESLQPFRTSLLERIDRRPSIFGKRLKAQAVGLLVKPLRGSRGRLDLSILPKAVIVDGLDEVRQDEEDQLEVLSVLMELATSEHFPFRIIVSSRPERSIEDFFLNPAVNITKKLFLDSRYSPEVDIEVFLQAKFAEFPRDEVSIVESLDVLYAFFEAVSFLQCGREHWRSGILVEAKAQNWCVHEVEEVQQDDISELEWKAGFKRLPALLPDGPPYTCSACPPPWL
ncbi:hypothetical protein NMY22_g11264 [Coprinellus aureogranulatus]|nr:hypothetical protein NMY22_g11264 [Coprinellus aureogranulatus]